MDVQVEEGHVRNAKLLIFRVGERGYGVHADSVHSVESVG